LIVKDHGFRFLFLADSQLGAYATFSGADEAAIKALAERDMHVAAVPRVEGFDWDAARYREAVAMANDIRPNFVVVGGDMIDDVTSQEQIDELLRITAGLDRDIPVYWVPGNHDIALDTVVPTPPSIDKYREVFGPDYYAFDYGGYRFIVLNTVVLDHPEEVPDELDSQMAFLEHELSATDAGRAVLFGHHPMFTATPDEPDTYWNLPMASRVPLLDLVHRHGVRVAFAGHWHRNSIAFDGEFQMVTSGPVGIPLGADPSGFRVVDVDGTGVAHRYLPLEAPTAG
jgi:3',5'-cyclic AMP phosphodiesterase CpdA